MGKIYFAHVICLKNLIQNRQSLVPQCQVSESWNVDYFVGNAYVVNLNKSLKCLYVTLYKSQRDRRDSLSSPPLTDTGGDQLGHPPYRTENLTDYISTSPLLLL